MRLYDADSAYDMDNPKHRQGLIDLLCDAGVLQKFQSGAWAVGDERGVTYAYRVVQPHKHEWRVDASYVSALMPTLFLRCECGVSREVPNKLPIEVPNA